MTRVDWAGHYFTYFQPGDTAPGALRKVEQLNAAGTRDGIAFYTYETHGRLLSQRPEPLVCLQ